MPVNMPSDMTCAVCITIDFDAISVWLSSEERSPTSISRGEFGARVGIWRILSLLDKHDVKTTFFVPGHTADTYTEIVKKIHEKGHEIAHHGYCHESPVDLKYEEEVSILDKGISSLKTITGKRPLGYRSPSWEISPNTLKLLLERDFIYDSSLMAEDFTLYKCRIGDKASMTKPFNFGRESRLLEFPVAWNLDDWVLFEHQESSGLSAPSKVYEIWAGDFDYMYEHVKNGVFTLTLHPQVIGRGHRIMVLEKLVKHMKSCPNVWFARMIDVAKAWKD